MLVNLILFSKLLLHRLFRNTWIRGGGQSIRVVTLNASIYIYGTHKTHNVLKQLECPFFFMREARRQEDEQNWQLKDNDKNSKSCEELTVSRSETGMCDHILPPLAGNAAIFES